MNEKGCANQTKSWVRDHILPFMVGFLGVLIIFYMNSSTDNNVASVQVVATFQDENGQTFLERPGFQAKVTDISRVRSDKMKMSIIAKAKGGFRKLFVGGGSHDPPGSIWPWPRIEGEALSTPVVWVVTPTYRNAYQYAELTRVAQAIYPARKLVRWIVVDDHRKSKGHPTHVKKLREFLTPFGLNFTVLKSKPRPESQRVVYKPKGVDARRTAIEYIRKRHLKGVVYFADDDNTYDSDIFRQIQGTKKVSIWPTGAITEWTVSAPVVNHKGYIVDFFDAFVGRRKFPVDFASFAINCELFHTKPAGNIPWVQGYEETKLLESLNANAMDMKPLAANATEVLAWHTKTVRNPADHNLSYKMRDRVNWPKSVRKLFEKYDFLVDAVVRPHRERDIGDDDVPYY